jgi:hypothetical protein
LYENSICKYFITLYSFVMERGVKDLNETDI